MLFLSSSIKQALGIIWVMDDRYSEFCKYYNVKTSENAVSKRLKSNRKDYFILSQKKKSPYYVSAIR